MFPIRLLPHGIHSREIHLERAAENDGIPFHLLSQSVATALGIRWQSFSYKPGPYRIVGLVRLTWARNEDSDRQSVLRTDVWYITPSKLPDGVQAVVGTSSFSLHSDVMMWTPANDISQPEVKYLAVRHEVNGLLEGPLTEVGGPQCYVPMVYT